MQPNERVGIVPVTLRPVPPVDHQDPCIAVAQQFVGKSHRCRAGTNDK